MAGNMVCESRIACMTNLLENFIWLLPQGCKASDYLAQKMSKASRIRYGLLYMLVIALLHQCEDEFTEADCSIHEVVDQF